MFDSCEKKIIIQNIIIATDRKWFDTTYKNHRCDLLMKIEKTKFQETQEAVKVYQEAFYVLDNKDYHDGILNNAQQCIESYGKGWEGFIFSENKPRTITSLSGLNIACPASGCQGTIKQTDCNLCGITICKDCHEIVKTSGHSCDPKTIETIQAIFKEARPCPKCSALISKIEGCDQMFCTQCHTTYSWDTGQVITGAVHNPHYFDWLAEEEKKRALPQRINTDCQEFISYERLISCLPSNKIKYFPPMSSYFDKFPSLEYYHLAFKKLHANILHVRATAGNHANVQEIDNHILRVKFMLGQIDEKELKETLFKEDYDFHRYISYFNIYLLVFQTTGILFDNLYAFTFDTKNKINDKKILKMKTIDFVHDIYVQIQKILEYGNEMLDYNNKCYGKDKLFVKFQRYPFS
jgi:hypothetical protein